MIQVVQVWAVVQSVMEPLEAQVLPIEMVPKTTQMPLMKVILPLRRFLCMF